MSYVVNGEVRISLISEGDLSNVINAQQIIINNQGRMTEGQRGSNQQTQQGAYLVRRLALDLRMFSIGLGILRREYEGINPLFDSFAGGLQIAGATATTVVGAIAMVSDISRILKNDTMGLRTAIEGLTSGGASFGALGAGAIVLSVALAALAGIVAGVFAFEVFTGITQYRAEITRLAEEITTLNTGLRNIGVEQSSLNAESAAYSAQLAVVNRQIELQGYATAEQTALQASLGSALSDVKTRQAEANAEAARTKFYIDQAKDSAEDYGEAIQETYAAVGKGMAGVAGPPVGTMGEAAPPVGQLGGEIGRTGIIKAERGEILMQKEQYASMLTSGGDSYQISISLAGANIRSDVDLESSLKKGGKAAADEIRLLEMRRRRIITKF